ncbi:MAG: DUF898 family protein [Bacteriovoracia bacterium]
MIMQIAFKPQDGFFKEIFLNLVLIFVTFGLYLPWGVTHIRRLVWSNIYLDGQRFYYLGKANEILKGYAALILLYLSSRLFTLLGENFADNEYLSLVLTIPASVLFFTLLYKAQMGSFKYQSQRTAFKGIRFRTTLPGFKKQYAECLKMAFFTILTFGLLYSYYYFKIEKMKYNSLEYGQQKFKFDLLFTTYMNVFLKHTLLFFFLLSVGFLLFRNSVESPVGVGALTSLFYLLLLPLAFLMFIHLLYSLFLLKIKHLSTQDLTFQSDLNFTSFFIHNLINIPILVFTLGLALPVVIARNIGIYANSVKVLGMESLETVAVAESHESFDEILSQSFDLDILDVF